MNVFEWFVSVCRAKAKCFIDFFNVGRIWKVQFANNNVAFDSPCFVFLNDPQSDIDIIRGVIGGIGFMDDK